MNNVDEARIRNNETRIKYLEADMNEVMETLRNIYGNPTIMAHHGVRLDLNDDLNVQNLNVTLKRMNERLFALETREA